LVNERPVRLAYQPPASSTFLSQQTSHQQPASSTFLSNKPAPGISHQPTEQAVSRLGQRHGLQSTTLTSYFYKNIY
jgi:hypothetical protein